MCPLTGSRRLLVLDPVSSDSEELIAAAAALGHELFLVSHVGKPPDSTPPGVMENLVVDLSGGENTLAQIVDHASAFRIDGVVTTREFLTPLAARLCAALAAPGNDAEMAEAARNKIVMAERFARFGVHAPETFVVNSAAEAMALIREGRISFPVAVKPAENAGSMGVSIVDCAEALASAFDRVWAQPTVYDLVLDQRVVLQEYVEGDEFSVEAVTQDGRTPHVCINRTITTAGVFRAEVGHSAPAQLDPSISERVLAEASKAVRAVGIHNGVSHTEVKVRPDNTCVVIETAARIGGGQIGALVDLTLGVNLYEASVRVALGQPVTAGNGGHRCATVRWVMAPSAGRLVDVRNLPAVGQDVHSVGLIRAIGSLVTGSESNWGRVGQFIVVGENEAEVNGRADDLLDRVEVVVEPADVKHP